MKIFSIPLNPKLSEEQFNQFIEFCQQYRDYIYDIYFTCRIPPFLQDAMGDIFIQTDDNLFAIEAALHVQQVTGIPVSATFNNIEVRSDQRALDIWIHHFKPLYDAGVRSCTLPHTQWMLTGQVKRAFPELFVKNTILRNVSEAREVAALAEAGFDYVNLDRVLMRDHDRLREIKRVKDRYNIKVSLLANEGCLGGCPIMDEHFQFNNTRGPGPQYFTDPISRVSCSKWEHDDIAVKLKTANIPPWREDWVEFIEDLGIDTFKMHGRENVDRMFETMDIIRRFANNEDILFDNFETYVEESNLTERPMNAWRTKIKTCKFDCWDCNYCDKVWHAKGNTNNKRVEAVAQAIVESVHDAVPNAIPGLTSNRVKQLLNRLGSLSTHYLEVGCLNGSTFCSTILNNELTCYAVDNWAEQTQAADNSTNLVSSKEIFIDQVKAIKGKNTIKLFDCDYIDVDKTKIDKIDFMFYDADHSEYATSAAITYFSEKFAPGAILVFDDANWEGVVSGVNKGIERSELKVAFSRVMLNEQESHQDWWNGLYILVLE